MLSIAEVARAIALIHTRSVSSLQDWITRHCTTNPWPTCDWKTELKTVSGLLSFKQLSYWLYLENSWSLCSLKALLRWSLASSILFCHHWPWGPPFHLHSSGLPSHYAYVVAHANRIAMLHHPQVTYLEVGKYLQARLKFLKEIFQKIILFIHVCNLFIDFFAYFTVSKCYVS